MPKSASSRRVAVLGGGIGGLSAAHELAKHGFEVDVYEASSTLGGKAKSQYLPGTGAHGRRDLSGEHGFRFYPHFYRQLIWTFSEIPDPMSPTGSVDGNLVGTTEAGIGLGQEDLLVGSVKLVDGLRVLREAGISGEVPHGRLRFQAVIRIQARTSPPTSAAGRRRHRKAGARLPGRRAGRGTSAAACRARVSSSPTGSL